MSDKITLSKATFSKLTGNQNTTYSSAFSRNGANTILETKARSLDKKIMYKFDENGDVLLDHKTFTELQEAYNKKNAVNLSHIKVEQDLKKTKEKLDRSIDELIEKANSFVNTALVETFKDFKKDLEFLDKKFDERANNFESVINVIQNNYEASKKANEEAIARLDKQNGAIKQEFQNTVKGIREIYDTNFFKAGLKWHLSYIITILLLIIFILLMFLTDSFRFNKQKNYLQTTAKSIQPYNNSLQSINIADSLSNANLYERSINRVQDFIYKIPKGSKMKLLAGVKGYKSIDDYKKNKVAYEVQSNLELIVLDIYYIQNSESLFVKGGSKEYWYLLEDFAFEIVE